MKAPVPVWSYAKSKALEDFASSYGIPVIDYIKNMDELGLNTSADFRNTGHVNDNGAGKIARNLGQYLVSNYNLPDRRKDGGGNTWDLSLRMLTVG